MRIFDRVHVIRYNLLDGSYLIEIQSTYPQLNGIYKCYKVAMTEESLPEKIRRLSYAKAPVPIHRRIFRVLKKLADKVAWMCRRIKLSLTKKSFILTPRCQYCFKSNKFFLMNEGADYSIIQCSHCEMKYKAVK